MMDNIVIPRQFVVDLRRAKMQQLRALQAEIAHYDRWLKLSINDAVPIPPDPNVTNIAKGQVEESEWS